MENIELKRKRVFVLCGIPGSGKSTLAKKLIETDIEGGNIVSRDVIRFSKLKENDDYFKYEDEVIKEFRQAIRDSIINNKNTYIDATHLSPRVRKNVLSYIPYSEDTYNIAISFEVPLEVALERNAGRSGRALVPESAIINMWGSYQIPSLKTELFDEVWHVDADENIRKEF